MSNNLLNLFNEAISGGGPLIIEFARENDFEEDDWSLSDLRNALDVYGSQTHPTFRGSPITVADSWGGEGQGDDIGAVYLLDDEYVRVSGYYSSYDGAYWDDSEPESVVPKEVTVTQYVSA